MATRLQRRLLQRRLLQLRQLRQLLQLRRLRRPWKPVRERLPAEPPAPNAAHRRALLLGALSALLPARAARAARAAEPGVDDPPADPARLAADDLPTEPAVPAAADLPDYPAVTPGHTLQFPHDFGAHPAFRTEWWYITGWSHAGESDPLGFQVTFFRSRPPLAQGDPSRFAPDQLLFAHAAIADPAVGRLLHDQRAARAGFGLADAAIGDTRVHIDDWRLERHPDGRYHSIIRAQAFTLELEFTATSPPLLEGNAGYSRKGPLPAQASYYYSQPQLRARGTLSRAGVHRSIDGIAWLDHEWSSEVLAADATGWDWTGINLDDGGALMAFRIRDRAGATLWAGGTLRQADGRRRTLAPVDVAFKPRRLWHSALTGADYPVAMQLRAGDISVVLDPLMDDQELDSRASTGAVYWEGAVTATQNGRAIGRGYLELTGYFRPLQF